MRVKIFRGHDMGVMEKEINNWLAKREYRSISRITQSESGYEVTEPGGYPVYKTLVQYGRRTICIWYHPKKD